MPKTTFDYAVFIGKFAPIHDGHVAVINQALQKADKIIVVMGGCFEARNTRMPFSDDERAAMIHMATNFDPRVLIAKSENFLYNDARWLSSVHDAVYDTIEDDGGDNPDVKIALAGLAKDSTSYYLNIFPQWRYDIKCDAYYATYKDHEEVLSSTMIRRKIFEGEIGYLRPYMDEKVVEFIDKRAIGPNLSDDWKRMNSDFAHETKYPSLYGHGPFMTTDACVTQAGHILLINRGREYGKGLYAMPGGFLNPREKLVDGMIREITEETMIKVPEPVLRGSIKTVKTYDDPYRSNRASLVTTCFRIDLAAVGNGLPKVKGADDAMHADWYHIGDIMSQKDMFFEDHWHIITDILGL